MDAQSTSVGTVPRHAENVGVNGQSTTASCATAFEKSVRKANAEAPLEKETIVQGGLCRAWERSD